MSSIAFRDRSEAGRRLGGHVAGLGLESPVVLGLARGGVPVAAEVATALGVGLDVFVACKIATPGHEEFGIGAVAEGLETPVISDAARELGVTERDLAGLEEDARQELARRVARYRGGRALPAMARRDVVLVDDGIATGVTALAALRALRLREPKRLVLGVPICVGETAEPLRAVADEVVCAEVPEKFGSVGHWYEDFSPTTDDEVLDLLARPADARRAAR